MKEKIYTINDVAKLFKVTRETVHAWLRSGRLVGFRPSGPNGHLRFRDSDLYKMIQDGSPHAHNYEPKKKAKKSATK